MRKNHFYRLGLRIYQFKWLIIVLWLALIVLCVPFLPHILSPFTTTGFVDEHSKSAITQSYVNKKLGFNNENKLIILYHSSTLRATEPEYNRKINDSLSKLGHFPLRHIIFLPSDNQQQISKDKHTAYVAVIITNPEPISGEMVKTFESLLKKPTGMTMELGGEPVFIDEVNEQTEKDLRKADVVATPAAIITLILVFGSLVAALLPIILGGGCALLILTVLYFFGHAFELSIFTLNIALLLGLCLSLDYSLFIISRFRDELLHQSSIKEAVAITSATAGKAIFFSGTAVFASLSALLLFPINILFSVAVGGLMAVVVSVMTAVILLPAVLAVLNHRINRLSVHGLRFSKRKPFNVWHWIALRVVKRPVFVIVPILVVLLALGYPSLHTTFGVADFRIFPEHSEDRQFFDTYNAKFSEGELTPISMVFENRSSAILSYPNLSRLYDVVQDLKKNQKIADLNGILTVNSSLNKRQYFNMYHLPKHELDSNIKKLLLTTTSHYMTVMDVVSKYHSNSKETSKLIQDLENTHVGHGIKVTLTGTPVSNRDVLAGVKHVLPYAILWIMVFTYLILLILLRSLILPIKAIFVNLLSLAACYGALVLVFQDGYLHHLLNFETQGMLDISLLVIIFCALFGFSMDYEVFLLTRIKEAYEETHDNKKSIVFGIEKSSRIITSAALIVIVLCGSFLVADVLMVKAFGLGIAVAIFVDAFLIRTFLVPAAMTIINRWNWYLPKCLDKILPKW